MVVLIFLGRTGRLQPAKARVTQGIRTIRNTIRYRQGYRGADGYNVSVLLGVILIICSFFVPCFVFPFGFVCLFMYLLIEKGGYDVNIHDKKSHIYK